MTDSENEELEISLPVHNGPTSNTGPQSCLHHRSNVQEVQLSLQVVDGGGLIRQGDIYGVESQLPIIDLGILLIHQTVKPQELLKLALTVAGASISTKFHQPDTLHQALH